MSIESGDKTSRAVRLGEAVLRCPITIHDKKAGSKSQPQMECRKGTVVYVHPLGRYHTVEFGKGKKVFRESFLGVEP